MQIEGVFRTRLDKDGSLEVWAPGWRLELRFAALLPPALAIGFLLSNLPIVTKVLFAAVLLGCGVVVHRITTTGIVLTADEVRLVGIGRTRRAKWDEVAGFVGERDAREGRPVLLIADGERLPAPGSLPSEMMDTYWDETEVSAIDQLNGIVDAFRRGEMPTAVAVPDKAPRRTRATAAMAARSASEGPPRTRVEDPSTPEPAKPAKTRGGRVRARRPANPADELVAIPIGGSVSASEPPQPIAAVEAEAAWPPTGTGGERADVPGAALKTPAPVPAYVAAAQQRSAAYPSRGAQRLAEWESTHVAPTPEEMPRSRRSRRRPRS